MRHSIYDTNMSYIDTCTIVIDVFYIGWTVILARWHTIFGITQNHGLRPHEGMCYSAPLPYLDEDGGTTATHRLSWCFNVELCFLSMNETNNPQHPDCSRSIPTISRCSGFLHSHTGMSNCIPHYSVGSSYLSMHEIPASGTKVLISGTIDANRLSTLGLMFHYNVTRSSSILNIRYFVFRFEQQPDILGWCWKHWTLLGMVEWKCWGLPGISW